MTRDPLDDRATCGQWLVLLAALALMWVGILMLGVVAWRWIA